MKRLTLVLALMLSQLAQAIELRDGKMVVSDVEKERLAVCEEQGGCHIVTVAQMNAMLQALAQAQVIKIIRDNRLSCVADL